MATEVKKPYTPPKMTRIHPCAHDPGSLRIIGTNGVGDLIYWCLGCGAYRIDGVWTIPILSQAVGS
jgi:hypothetical protein